MDESPERVRANLAKAVAIMTAWSESDDGDTSFSIDTLASYLNDAPTGIEREVAVSSLLAGLMSLCGHLLIMLGDATEREMTDLLAEIAAIDSA
jgi:hypothetical protein